MWLMLDTGFISIVEHQESPDWLLVRSRVKADITNVFGDDIEVETLPGADYLYRAIIDRDRVANTLWEKIWTLDYASHAKDIAIKRSAPAVGRSAAYYATWTAMSKMQPIPPYSYRIDPLQQDGEEIWWEDEIPADDWMSRRERARFTEPTSDARERVRVGDFELEDDGEGGVRTVTE